MHGKGDKCVHKLAYDGVRRADVTWPSVNERSYVSPSKRAVRVGARVRDIPVNSLQLLLKYEVQICETFVKLWLVP